MDKKLKRGDIREDGKVFWGYRKASKNGEYWTSPERFADMDRKLTSPEFRKQRNENQRNRYRERAQDPEYQKRKADYGREQYDKRNPPSKRTLELRKRKGEMSPDDYKKLRKKESQQRRKEKYATSESIAQRSREKVAERYQRIKSDPVAYAKYRAKKSATAKKRYEIRKNLPQVVIERSVRARLAKRLGSKGTDFTKRFDALIGCSPEFLQKHIESLFTPKMTWGNRASYWEVDHIRPLASFNLNNENDYFAANHYTNLQPLEKTKNNKKSDSWDGQTDMLSKLL